MPQFAPYKTAPNAHPHKVRYGFFGAKGGVSSGLYDSLNCGMGSDDDQALVRQNRAIAASSLAADEASLASLYQIHSADVITITERAQLSSRPRADGLVTALPNITLSILTADCTPLLFYDEAAGIIGACHAGWRGAAGGVIQNSIAAMIDLGASPASIICLIGPTIAKASYQTGADMRDAVLSLAPDAAPFFEKDPAKDTHYLFDLPAFAAHCARQAGLSAIHDLAIDTYRESSQFFSHRRATHQGQKDTGRQISLITNTVT